MTYFRRIVTYTLQHIGKIAYNNYETRYVIQHNITSAFSTCLQPNFNIFNNKLTPHEALFVRSYAKGKDKKKEKGKAKVAINENELSAFINVDSLKKQLEKPLELMKNEYMKQLSLRTSSGSIEMLTINFEDKDYTIQEIAQVVRKNPTTLVINMSVFPQAIPTVLKAIQKSGYNLNPQQEGTTLYVPIPKITQEHRENLAKTAKQLFIKCKDAIRDIQIKQTKSIKKKDACSEDLLRNIEHQVVALADTYISQAETIYNTKSNELLGKN